MRWLLCTWDPAHRLELCLADVRADKPAVAEYLEGGGEGDHGLPRISWYKPIAGHISELYNKYSYGKGYETLLDLAAEGGPPIV